MQELRTKHEVVMKKNDVKKANKNPKKIMLVIKDVAVDQDVAIPQSKTYT